MFSSTKTAKYVAIFNARKALDDDPVDYFDS